MSGNAYCFVVNPAACRGRGIRRLPAVLGPLSAAGASVRVEESSSLGHAATVAADAAGQGETVVAVGGDGTVGAMAAAVSAVDGVLGIIPAGRGNDFARMLGIPADPARAAAVLLRGGHRMVDLIGVAAGDGRNRSSRAVSTSAFPSKARGLPRPAGCRRGAWGTR